MSSTCPGLPFDPQPRPCRQAAAPVRLRSHHRGALFISIIAASLAGTVQAAPGASRPTPSQMQAGAGTCGAWQATTVPYAGTDPALWSVDGAAPDDVWAVGAFYNPLAHVQVQHWNGESWSAVPDGGTDLPVSALRGVAAVAADDVWAVGLYNSVADGTGPIRPLAQHWDGSTWTVVAAPEAGVSGLLVDVAAAASDDVWAVGSYSVTPGDLRALIQHWDGTSWTSVPSPEVGFYHALNAVAVTAPDDVWALGRMNKDGQWTTLVEHWDGTAWTVVPSGSQPGGILNAIAVAAPDDIWAVGTATVANTVVTMHWNGSAWSVFANGLAAITLDDVTAVGPDDVWAVGTGPDIGPLTVHWDGQAWRAAPSIGGFTFHSATSFAHGDVWAVGQATGDAIAAHYSDPCTPGGQAAPAPR